MITEVNFTHLTARNTKQVFSHETNVNSIPLRFPVVMKRSCYELRCLAYIWYKVEGSGKRDASIFVTKKLGPNILVFWTLSFHTSARSGPAQSPLPHSQQHTYMIEPLPPIHHFDANPDAIPLPWSWRQYISPECRFQHAILHAGDYQK